MGAFLATLFALVVSGLPSTCCTMAGLFIATLETTPGLALSRFHFLKFPAVVFEHWVVFIVLLQLCITASILTLSFPIDCTHALHKLILCGTTSCTYARCAVRNFLASVKGD